MRALAFVLVLVLHGCGDDGFRPPIDPIITDLTATPVIVATGMQSTITAEGYDREHRPLTYTWEATGGTLTGTGDSVVWTAPEEEGTYSVFLTILDDEGGTDADSVFLVVRDGALLINTGGGLLVYDFHGDYSHLTHGRTLGGTGLLKGDDLEVLGPRIYLSGLNGEYRILEMGHGGELISYTSPFRPDIYAAGFTVLPDGGFAVLDNLSDSVHLADPNGSPRATIPIPNAIPGLFGRQTVDGLVVGNRLIASETGHDQIFQVDLTTYEASILFEFSESDSWLGAIAHDSDETFYVYMYREGKSTVYSFTEKGEERRLCTLPEGHISGLASVGAYLFAAVNHAGAVYRINRFDGTHEEVLTGLDWPTDVEYIPARIGGS